MSNITSFSELFLICWHAWKHMFAAMPYGDPYVAMLALAVAVGALGYSIKYVMD